MAEVRWTMQLPQKSYLLRVFLGESTRLHGKPLYEVIVLKARELGMAGATVVRGVMGFGASSRVHTLKLLRLSEDLPVIVEIVDRRDRVDLLLPFLDETVKEGLVTLEEVEVLHYRHREGQ
jgi:uncharacterized protein